MQALNFDALQAAIAQFEKGIQEAFRHRENELMRDGVIQRFEYTMDLSWKMIQRYLKLIQVEESAIRSKNDLFREAARLQIIEDAETWIGHYAARNESSHDYHTEKAEQVFAQAKLFLPDVKKLLETLQNVS
ncbi:MAG: HI0074 family nucleotidyltransferase substrate-binding subunit [Gammaproteobacteria bacterium]|jgi:nucleotidyltransferase substrate binding protein (TIGR01987 family)|nr:HI0074 family nucleotidyltransferase substrate-binding subunit [Gammaproteobacteria bacterium]